MLIKITNFNLKIEIHLNKNKICIYKFMLVGGVFNHTIELSFKSTSDKVLISNKYLGLDVFGQLKMESEIRGTLPFVEEGDRIDYGDYEVLLTRTQPGIIRSNTERNYRLAGSPLFERLFIEDQIIYYNECSFSPHDVESEISKLKFSRGITAYENREGIIRFATNAKIMQFEDVDPCIQGRLTCSIHSSCIADGDNFRCICEPG
jgi:nidogen (entactin)